MNVDFIYIIGPHGVRCPFCAQVIPADALICSHCQSDLESSSEWEERVRAYHRSNRRWALAGLLTILAVLAFIFGPNHLPDWSRPPDAEKLAASPSERTATDVVRATTPHPAKDAIAEAVRMYPALGQKDSALNKAFLALHEKAKSDDPKLLSAPDWPLIIAERAALANGIAPSSGRVRALDVIDGYGSLKLGAARAQVQGRLSKFFKTGSFETPDTYYYSVKLLPGEDSWGGVKIEGAHVNMQGGIVRCIRLDLPNRDATDTLCEAFKIKYGKPDPNTEFPIVTFKGEDTEVVFFFPDSVTIEKKSVVARAMQLERQQEESKRKAIGDAAKNVEKAL